MDTAAHVVATPGWASRLLAAADGAEPLAARFDGTIADAYRVQAELIAQRLARGEHAIGFRVVPGADALLHGCLTDALQVADGGVLTLAPLIVPRVRPALAFRIARPIPPDATRAEVDPALGTVAPAIDVADTRWRGDPAAAAQIADDAGAGAVAIGTWRAPLPDRLERVALELRLDPPSATGAPEAVAIDDPLGLARAAIAHRHARGETIEAGAVIVITAPIRGFVLTPGTAVLVRTTAIGEASILTRA
jgi:2-oxo-3-hexenedioate decarboxylase